MGLLTLTKVSFLYFGLAGLLVLTGGGAIALFRFKTWRPLAVALALAVGFLPPVAGWTIRNGIVLGHYTVSEGRASESIGYRVAFNDLSARQIAAGFVHWTRGFGDKLSYLLFEPEAVAPFDWSKPGNFYETVGNSIHRKVIETTEAHGGDLRGGENEVTGQFLAEIRSRPLKHLATTTLFVYRGLWVDEFILVGLPLLLIVVWQALRHWQWELLILLSPGLYGMLFYSFFTLNIPRYQLTSMPTLAVGAVLGAMYLLAGYRQRRLAHSPAGDNALTRGRAGLLWTQGWTEKPGDHHQVSHNASDTEPAKLLAIFVVDTGDKKIVMPDK